MTQLKGFEFVKTLVLVLKKIETEDKTKYKNFYSSSKVEIIIGESDIEDVLQSIYTITNYNEHSKIFRKRFRLDY